MELVPKGLGIPHVNRDDRRLTRLQRPNREAEVELDHDEEKGHEQEHHRAERMLHEPKRVARDDRLQVEHDPHVVLKQANADQVASDPVSYQLDRVLVRDLAEDPHHQDTDQQRDRRHRPDRVEGLKRPTDDVEDEGENAVDRARDHRHHFDSRPSTVNFRRSTMNFRLVIPCQVVKPPHTTHRSENRVGNVEKSAFGPCPLAPRCS